MNQQERLVDEKLRHIFRNWPLHPKTLQSEMQELAELMGFGELIEPPDPEPLINEIEVIFNGESIFTHSTLVGN